MTLTPLLKELKEKAIRIEKDPIGEFYCNPRSILFLIQAIEEMKEALEKITNTKCFWTEEPCHHNIADEVLEKYFGEK